MDVTRLPDIDSGDRFSLRGGRRGVRVCNVTVVCACM